MDGRDVPSTPSPEYVAQLEAVLSELNTEGCDYASGGGRMQVTMDRYEANWGIAEKGRRTPVPLLPPALAAIEVYCAETCCLAQDPPAFSVERNGEPVVLFKAGITAYAASEAQRYSPCFRNRSCSGKLDNSPKVYEGITGKMV